MYADRIDVLHVTYGNTVAVRITHYLVLNFLPSGDAALYKNLTDTAKTKSVTQDINKFLLVVGNTTAASSKCESRAKYNRITDRICELDTVFYGINDL